MTEICPRCNARCGDDHLYCFSCGMPLAGVADEREQASGEARAAGDGTPSTASTWPVQEHHPVETRAGSQPAAASPARAEVDDDRAFVPLQFDTSGPGRHRNRRIWLLVMAVVALLTVGIVAALVLREGYGGEDEPEGPLAVVQDPSTPTESRPDKVATPTVVTVTRAGSGGEAVVASPLPTSPVSPAARATQVPESPTTTTPQAVAIPRLTPTSEPTVVNEVQEATPIARPARGDGTGGAVLLPIESTPIPEIGPPNRIRTPDAD